jgi:hypothetical protein
LEVLRRVDIDVIRDITDFDGCNSRGVCPQPRAGPTVAMEITLNIVPYARVQQHWCAPPTAVGGNGRDGAPTPRADQTLDCRSGHKGLVDECDDDRGRSNRFSPIKSGPQAV